MSDAAPASLHTHTQISLAQIFFVCLQDGLESKNNKTRVVCADELAALIERNGPSLYRPSGVCVCVSVRACVRVRVLRECAQQSTLG